MNIFELLREVDAVELKLKPDWWDGGLGPTPLEKLILDAGQPLQIAKP